MVVVVDPQPTHLIQAGVGGAVLLVTHLKVIRAGHIHHITEAMGGLTHVRDLLTTVDHQLVDTGLTVADTILGLTAQKSATTGGPSTTLGAIHLSTGVEAAGVIALFLAVYLLLQGGITGVTTTLLVHRQLGQGEEVTLQVFPLVADQEALLIQVGVAL